MSDNFNILKNVLRSKNIIFSPFTKMIIYFVLVGIVVLIGVITTRSLNNFPN